MKAACTDCAVNCGIVITPGSRKCALFYTLPWHDWKTMVPWIGHFNIKCACTSQGKGVLSITFSELSKAALAALASLSTYLQLHGNTRLNLPVHISPWAYYILHTFESVLLCVVCAYSKFFFFFFTCIFNQSKHLETQFCCYWEVLKKEIHAKIGLKYFSKTFQNVFFFFSPQNTTDSGWSRAHEK